MRRLIAAFFLILLAFWATQMETWSKKVTIIPEESVIPIDWELHLNNLGYSLYKQDTESEEISNSLPLYAKAAVLLDANSGRVLYGKSADIELPMASTTKIMTCILAL